jgi:hypothetical protein
VWRTENTYVFKGTVSSLQADGSLKLSTFNQFDFSSGATNAGWQQTGAVTRYDHYSLPVETKNTITGINSSVKTDFNNKFVLATAANANYNEFAFSGAEDGTTGTVYFGGEIALGGGTLVTVPAPDCGATNQAPATGCHTGQAAVQVAPGANTFVYKPSAALTPGRAYRARVWASSANWAVYYVSGGTTYTLTAQNVPASAISKVGSWYRITADNLPSTLTEVGVTSTSGTVTYDDFRFQPRDASVTAKVYDASTGYLTYILGDDNLYTRYQYDCRGVVMQTYVETIKYNGEKLVKARKDNYRRSSVDQ